VLLLSFVLLRSLLQRWRRRAARAPRRIRDNFRTLAALKRRLREIRFEGCALVIGIDFSKSNDTQGARTHGGFSLHARRRDGAAVVPSPYETVIRAIHDALAEFDDDGVIPLFGFGDSETKDRSVFALNGSTTSPGVRGVETALSLYHNALVTRSLSGPTSLVPIIRRGVDLARSERCFHLLIIITDGDISDVEQTRAAVTLASNEDLAIVIVGVGDGPFTTLEMLDDHVPERTFDNCQFVNFETLRAAYSPGGERFDEFFSLCALMELPEQWAFIRERALRRQSTG